jgi:hypothetical protein
MSKSPAETLTDGIDAVERARTAIVKNRNRQVRSKETRLALRSLAFAWFQSYRPSLASSVSGVDDLRDADAAFQALMDATDKNAAKSTYSASLSRAKSALSVLRRSVVVARPVLSDSGDAVPDFSPLASDVTMKGILERRWDECRRCIEAGANLAAVVMMGGLLEALFVARANKLIDKKALFRAKLTPLDAKTKKALDLRDWTLKAYIDIAHELGWITPSAKDVAAVLRDYRNYVHPEKERSHGVVLTDGDSAMLWQVTRSLARQLLDTGP